MKIPLNKHVLPVLSGLALLVIAQAGVAAPAQAQDRETAEEARHRADCRLAHQVLTTGQPAVKRDWAVSIIRGCPGQGGEALATELRRLRATDERTDELEKLVWATGWLVDPALVEAGLEVATDPGAGTVARIQAMRVVSNQMTPVTFISWEDFVEPGGMGTGGFISSTGHPTVGDPLTREIVEGVRDALAPLAEDTSAPELVRIAAANLAAHARAELEACPENPWYVYWGPC